MRKLKIYLLLVLILLIHSVANAALTASQKATLKTDITVTNAAEFASALAASDTQAIADAYNQPAAVAYWVWRTNVSKSDIYFLTSIDGTTWTWATYINQSAGEKSAWEEMFYLGAANFALANTQSAVTNIFSGSGAPATQRTHIFTVARRLAKRGEKLFATGTGSTGSPGVMSFEGNLTAADVASALNS